MSESNTPPASVIKDRSQGRTQEVLWRRYLEKAAGGDDQALAALYDESSRLVHAVAMRFLADQADADEVTLDVFTQVWRSASVFDSTRGSVSAWLVTIARSRAIDRLRSVAPRLQRQESMEDGFELAEKRATPEQVSLLNQLQRSVRLALATLPVEQRRAINLAYFGDLSHQEISTSLGLPLGTVKTRIRLGMLRLRDHLSASAVGAGGEI